jgi:hypothetical protein
MNIAPSTYDIDALRHTIFSVGTGRAVHVLFAKQPRHWIEHKDFIGRNMEAARDFRRRMLTENDDAGINTLNEGAERGT